MQNSFNPLIPTVTRKSTCMNCLVKNFSLLNELSYVELEILNKNRYTVNYKIGEIIFKEGAKSMGLLCLNKGKVKISKIGANGTEQITALRKPTDFIGFRDLLNDSSYLVTAVALEDVSVCVIDKKDFFEVIEGNQNLALKIIRFLANELNEKDNVMVNLTQKHIRARLAEALITINNVYGFHPQTGILNVSLKRSDIAALSNMTTANAIRVLSSFTNEKLIEIKQRDIKINNLAALKEISVFGT